MDICANSATCCTNASNAAVTIIVRYALNLGTLQQNAPYAADHTPQTIKDANNTAVF